MEDVTPSRNILEDTPLNRADEAAQEAIIDAEERIDDLMHAIYQLRRAAASGDLAWIADATDELNLLLN